jgi:myo-inositol-1(or 4)-monophosphatase
MNLSEILLKTIEIVKENGKYLKQEFENCKQIPIEIKEKNSLVSYVDKTCEKQLVKALNLILPEAKFITEEQTISQNNAALHWIIDPLDGTTNFLHQFPFFSISVALYDAEKPLIGVVYNVIQDEMFYAEIEKGAFKNGKQIHCSNKISLSETLIGTGFPYSDYTTLHAFQLTLNQLFHKTHGIRRCGSAAIDICYTANGIFDAFWEQSLNAWDVAAGIIIAKEAGCIVSDFDGNDNYLYGKEIIVSSANIFNDFYKIINQNYKNKIS